MPNSVKKKPGISSRDRETMRIVESILQQNPVDVKLLRKIAAVRGLVSTEIRAVAWPLLLGVDTAKVDVQKYREKALERHRDSSTVQCDVDRSLWHHTQDWSDEKRAAKRAALQRVLNGVVGFHAGDVFYYQGLHDVASILLLVCGEEAAYALLDRLVLHHLRDCTRRAHPAQQRAPGESLPRADPAQHPASSRIASPRIACLGVAVAAEEEGAGQGASQS